MEASLIFLALLATAAARPSTDYVPTKEQLALIFRDSSPSQNETPTLKNPATKDSYVINASQTPARVELNTRITFKDNDVQRVIINDNSTSNGTKNDKPDSGKGVVKTGEVDDRVAVGAAACPGAVRLGSICQASA